MNCLWYTEAAKSWIEALPLGNGRMGAMISGEPFCGQIQMNEESIVYGGPLDRINPDAAKYFPGNPETGAGRKDPGSSETGTFCIVWNTSERTAVSDHV